MLGPFVEFHIITVCTKKTQACHSRNSIYFSKGNFTRDKTYSTLHYTCFLDALLKYCKKRPFSKKVSPCCCWHARSKTNSRHSLWCSTCITLFTVLGSQRTKKVSLESLSNPLKYTKGKTSMHGLSVPRSPLHLFPGNQHSLPPGWTSGHMVCYHTPSIFKQRRTTQSGSEKESMQGGCIQGEPFNPKILSQMKTYRVMSGLNISLSSGGTNLSFSECRNIMRRYVLY